MGTRKGRSSAASAAASLGRPAPRRGAQGRHVAVLRPGRVHRDVGVGRPRRRRPDARRVLRDGARRRSRPTAASVEKFIGDAVVGVFGVPAAHEDDPERAVRAALRIVEAAEALEAVGGAPLRLRVGINTGEALVRLGVAPGSGEGFLAGRRDQHRVADPVGRAGDGCRGRARDLRGDPAVFDYEELEPATLKGKAEPVRVFHAKAHGRGSGPTSRGRTTRRSSAGRSTSRSSKASSTRPWPPTRPARDGRRRAGSRQEPARGGARRLRRRTPRSRHLAARTMPAVRRGHHVLGPRRDPQGTRRDPGIRPARRRARQARVVLPEGAEREWFRQRLLPLARDRGDLDRRARGALHRVAAIPRARRGGVPDRARVRGPALGGRGDARVPGAPRRTGRRACRCSWSAPPAPSCSTPPRLRAGAPQRQPDQPRSADRGGNGASRLRAAGDDA